MMLDEDVHGGGDRRHDTRRSDIPPWETQPATMDDSLVWQWHSTRRGRRTHASRIAHRCSCNGQQKSAASVQSQFHVGVDRVHMWKLGFTRNFDDTLTTSCAILMISCREYRDCEGHGDNSPTVVRGLLFRKLSFLGPSVREKSIQ